MSGCEGYDAIAGVYDRLNAEIDYGVWADFVERAFDKYLPARPSLVLDLACGTGRMTRELADRGYDMIGVDGSPDMLSLAQEAREDRDILYLMQDMRSFELYGTVGAVVCCLDSINYLLSEKDLRQTFAGVHNYLDPDGLLLFDVNTPYKFENIYGDNAYVLEDEDGEGRGIYCGWQNQYDSESGICDFYLSVFEEMYDGSYRRADEHQRERVYSLDTLCRILTECGFEVVGVFGDLDMNPPGEETPRWYIAAIAKK